MTTIYIAEEFCEISMSKGALFIEIDATKKYVTILTKWFQRKELKCEEL